MACSVLSENEIDLLFDRTPVDALNVASYRILSEQLNKTGKLVELADDSGRCVCDDYTGIAEQEKFLREEIIELTESADPTKSLVYEMAGKECTVGHLRRDLLNMGRMDVMRMSHWNWVNDCKVYEKRSENGRRSKEYDTDLTKPQDEHFDGGHFKMFDAFLSFAYGDLLIAKRMIKKLEKEKNFSLFIPGRDDLPGGAKYVLFADAIEERCRRVIIVLTRKFLSSPECDFQVRFANALDPGAIGMKIIPVICEKNVEVPRFLKAIKTCDITKGEWPSLYRALYYKPPTRFLARLAYPFSAKLKVKPKGEIGGPCGDRYQPDGESTSTQDDMPDEDLKCNVIFV